ncbi:Phosphoglycerol transferase I [Pseudoalteromonas luteoviolacea B = ATCC 29581]|nr:Phosphoglycerol transferase I [Pseudoalteromonas luteoviolacea B = ATCC 29581]
MGLTIFLISRIGLMLWQNERIATLDNAWHILIQGLRIDLSSLAYLCFIPFLIHFLLPNKQILKSIWDRLLKIYITGIVIFLVYMELVTPTFILEYDLRPNRLFIEYLEYPKEVFGMLWTGYKLSIFSVLVGTGVFAWCVWKIISKADLNVPVTSILHRVTYFFIGLLILVILARSSFGHRPLNPSLVAFSEDVLLNELTLNSTYSLAFAIKNMSAEKSAESFYGKMDKDRMVELVIDATGRKNSFFRDEIPTHNKITASYGGKKRNIVILLQESLGARFVGAMGGLPLTPNLDKLMQEGWVFEQLFATGTRSVRGIEAITTGFLPTPSQAVVKLSKSQTGFFTIAQLLKQQGYYTQFIYGGESHFDNMKSFFLGNGFSDIVDLPKFAKTSFVGSWGASDQDLYRQAHLEFETLAKGEQPFFSLVFTSSNHTPYEYPEGVIEPFDNAFNTRNNTIKYSDHALGEFFDQAKKSAYWDNTLFLIVADHDARVDATAPVPIKNFHIPGVILGKGIAAKKDSRIASSIDMPVTMLSLAGVTIDSPMLGFDMTNEDPLLNHRAIMQFGNNFGYLTQGDLTVLQPDKPAIAFKYQGVDNPLESIEAEPSQVEVVRAHALLGNYLYSERLYHLKENN